MVLCLSPTHNEAKPQLRRKEMVFSLLPMLNQTISKLPDKSRKGFISLQMSFGRLCKTRLFSFKLNLFPVRGSKTYNLPLFPIM